MSFHIVTHKFCNICGINVTGLYNCPRCHIIDFVFINVVEDLTHPFIKKSSIKRYDFQLNLFYDPPGNS